MNSQTDPLPQSRDDRLSDVLGDIGVSYNYARAGVWDRARDGLVAALAALDAIRPEMEAVDAWS